MRPVFGSFRALLWLARPPKYDLRKFVDTISEWASVARSQGTLALEELIETVSEPMQRQGLQLIVDNNSADDVESILSVFSENEERTQAEVAEVWEAIGGYSPTIGVMGAVLGLIHVMMRLDHPEELGEGIATAFVATIYGVGFANLIALPLGSRLKHLVKELARERLVVIQGFVLLAEGKPGSAIRQNLGAFLPATAADKPGGMPEAEASSIGE
jgi:chemotaxis protein MotA